MKAAPAIPMFQGVPPHAWYSEKLFFFEKLIRKGTPQEAD